MKVCSECGALCADSDEKCPECSSIYLSYKCANCGEVYDASFCPMCGVEAGNEGKMCPNCNKLYFGRSCPDCGYREPSPTATKVYKPSAQSAKTGDGAGEESGKPAVDLSGKGYSAETLLLADIAMQKKSGKPADFSMLMPEKSSCRKSTALFLCIFFGWLGAHLYYVGNSKKGMLYMMTFGMMGVGIIMDAFAIIRGDFVDKKGLPLS